MEGGQLAKRKRREKEKEKGRKKCAGQDRGVVEGEIGIQFPPLLPCVVGRDDCSILPRGKREKELSRGDPGLGEPSGLLAWRARATGLAWPGRDRSLVAE